MNRIIIVAAAMAMVSNCASARDNGRYADAPLKPWFDSLKSGKGPCCSVADGVTIKDVDWDSANGHYRVHLPDGWIVVPDDAVITQPNLYGLPVVWPMYIDGKPIIRCFIPGSAG